MKKKRFIASLLALSLIASMAACTEDSGSGSSKSTSVSASDQSSSDSSSESSAAVTTTTQSQTETTTTTTSESTTTTQETTTTQQTTTEQTKKQTSESYTDAIKADVESCISGDAVDIIGLLEKWNINASQMGWGGPNNRFTMQFRRNDADTKTECMVISSHSDKSQSYTIYFNQRPNDYPTYKVSYGDEIMTMSGYDFVCLYNVVSFDDYSLCTTEPYVDMSLDMGQ